MSGQEQSLWKRQDGFAISTDKQLLDKTVIHRFLSEDSYWVQGIDVELVEACIANSTLCYGVYEGDPAEGPAVQIGFARVVSDLVRYAWLGDVFILPAYRGHGLGKWLMSVITEHPRLKGVGFHLGTRDAHGLYAQFGFQPIGQIANKMVRPLNWDLVREGYGLKA